ncbi:MAG: alpha/beta hydrolase [Haloarculaceae archaeon]
MADEPHPQVQAVLQMLDSQPVPPTEAVSVAEARRQMEAMAAMRSGPEVGEVKNFDVAGPDGPLSTRLYLPEGEAPHPGLVFFHGGGFVIGSLDTHDALARALCDAADCAVLSVDYRLAPEHPFPAAFEDAYGAVEWIAEFGPDVDVDPDRIAVAGDSAGGNLAAAVSLATHDRDGPELTHQGLIYPVVSSTIHEPLESYHENAEGYFLETGTMQWFDEQYVQDEADRRNAYYAPLLARDHSVVPPATIVTAGFDPLRDEGDVYAERLREAGVEVDYVEYEDMIHGFASMLGAVDAAEDAVETLGANLRDSF